jgi:hypothetical protein
MRKYKKLSGLVLAVLLVSNSGKSAAQAQQEEVAQPPQKAVPKTPPKEVPPPEITPGPSISLQQALEQAEERNLDLSVAQMEVT